MRIGVDITNLDPDFFGGSDTYCNGLLSGLKKNKQNSFQVYVNKKYFYKRKLKSIKNLNFIIIEYSYLNFLLRKIYNRIFPYLSIFLFNFKYLFEFYFRNFLNHKFKLIVEKNSDCLITPNVNLTSYNLKIPTITNMQDLQHIYFPHFFSFSENRRRDYTFFNTAKYTSIIISSTNFIKKNLLENFNFLQNSKIKIIPSGVLKPRRNYTFKTKKYKSFFFLPAQFWKHKNHLLVLSAYEEYLEKSKLKRSLILCGKKYGNFDLRLKKYFIKLKKKVRYLGVIDENKLQKYYEDSFCTICPALYEAASLTMLEAISKNSYVLSSNIAPHKEDGKNFKIEYFRTFSKSDLVKKMIKLDKNFKVIKKNMLHNRIKIKNFFWEKQAEKWIQTLNNLKNDQHR